MSTMKVRLCDIKRCEELARYSVLVFVHGEQKGEDSFGAWVYPHNVDLCGTHEYEYRRSLPKLELKKELAKNEIRMDKHENPYPGDES